MDPGIRHGILKGAALAVLALVSAPEPVRSQAAAEVSDSLPPGVTVTMLQRGRTVYAGAGLCLACHGADGKGTIGPSLVDGEWLHVDGSYDALVRLITTGVEMARSKTGQMMPPRGGSALRDEDVRAVAAYVWAWRRGVKVP